MNVARPGRSAASASQVARSRLVSSRGSPAPPDSDRISGVVMLGGQHRHRPRPGATDLHGPYAGWTRKIAGKTITRRLTPPSSPNTSPCFDNAKKLRALLAELQDLTLEIIEADSQQP
jgi:hypothetical protein